MNENEKNSINSDAPEKNLAEEYNSVFDYNTETFIEHDRMNRDYLRLIYNDDMECLNKETRFTRSQYLKRMEDIETTYDKEIKANKKKAVDFYGDSGCGNNNFGSFLFRCSALQRNIFNAYAGLCKNLYRSKIQDSLLGGGRLFRHGFMGVFYSGNSSVPVFRLRYNKNQ